MTALVPTIIANAQLQSELADFLGWVHDFLDYDTLASLLQREGCYTAESAMAKWRNYEQDPVGFLVQWGDRLAAFYLAEVWPGKVSG